MTVGELKSLLENYDDTDEVMYFDSEAGEDVHLSASWLSIVEGSSEKER